MQIKRTIKIGKKIYKLRRIHSKLGESITWEVLNSDFSLRIGIIARYNSHWLSKRIGTKEFPIRYWLLHSFWNPKVISGKSIKEILSNLSK